MSDVALVQDNTNPVNTSVRKSYRYDPDKDRERMRVYMSHVREKNRAGFVGTVKAWLASK